MPVFTIEIDTDAKTCKKMVNGMEVDFDTMEVYQYSYNDRCDDDDKKIYHYGVRIGMENKEESITQNFRWEESENYISEIENEKSVLSKAEAEEEKEEKKKYYLFDRYKKKRSF